MDKKWTVKMCHSWTTRIFFKDRQIFNLNRFLHFAEMWVPSIISKPSLNEVQAQVSCQWILGYKGEEQWSGILRKGGGDHGSWKDKRK